jgi:GntR family transcriptional regulator, transcriptional repressor for pyruvate dehydrogenase complex
MFEPVGKTRLLSKLVESQIEEAIRSKAVLPGEKLSSEQELCKQFNVSRTALREALRMLAARGLVVIMKGKGIYVQNISAETVTDPIYLYLQMQSDSNYILDVIHARQIIEPPIAALAALYHTQADAERLKNDQSAFIASGGNDQDLSRLDMNFHLDIAKASENLLVPLLLEPLHRLAPRIRSSVYATVTDAKKLAVEWHENILTAILDRNAENARLAMVRHLEIAEQHDQQIIHSQKHDEKRK